MNPRRLYRSRTDRKLVGVAGGIAEYLDIDPTVVRVLWVLSVFLGGFTILLYIVCAFVMPLAPAVPASPAGPVWPTGPASPAGPASPEVSVAGADPTSAAAPEPDPR